MNGLKYLYLAGAFFAVVFVFAVFAMTGGLPNCIVSVATNHSLATLIVVLSLISISCIFYFLALKKAANLPRGS